MCNLIFGFKQSHCRIFYTSNFFHVDILYLLIELQETLMMTSEYFLFEIRWHFIREIWINEKYSRMRNRIK